MVGSAIGDAVENDLLIGLGDDLCPRSPGDPLVWIPDIEALYDARDESSITVTVGASQWNDLTTNGHHLKMTVAAQQGEYVTDDGLPHILFDGTDDSIFASAAEAFAGAQPHRYTIFCVMRLVTLQSGNHYFMHVTSAFNGGLMFMRRDGITPGARGYMFAGGDRNTDAVPDTTQIRLCANHPLSAGLRCDIAGYRTLYGGSSGPLTRNFDFLSLGSAVNGTLVTSNHTNCAVYAAGVVPREMTGEEITLLRRWARYEFGALV